MRAAILYTCVQTCVQTTTLHDEPVVSQYQQLLPSQSQQQPMSGIQINPVISQVYRPEQYNIIQPVNNQEHNSVTSLSNTAQIISGANSELYNNNENYNMSFPPLK